MAKSAIHQPAEERMAKGGRPKDETLGRGARRRRRPPVLELKATEIGGDRTKQSEKPKPETEQPGADARSGRRDPFKVLDFAASDWRSLASKPLVAGSAGVLAGAIVVFVLMTLSAKDRGGDERVSELTSEVAALAARIESLSKRPAPASTAQNGLGARLDRIAAAIGETEQRLAKIEQQPPPPAPDLSIVNQRTAAIESTLKDLRTALQDVRRMAEQAPPAATPAAVETLGERIGALEARVSALATPRPGPSVSALAGEVAALNALAASVKSGQPFTKELEAVRARIGERAAALAELEPYAAKGLPTTAALTERFKALAPALLRAPEPDAGFLSRLFSGASRLVEIRRVGEPEGKDVDAVVARMEARLARGDLAGAVAESALLPERANGIAADWIAAARQRRDAEGAIQGLIDAALTNSAGRKQS